MLKGILRLNDLSLPVTKGVTTPVTKHTILLNTVAGILPYLSANQPKKIIPGIAPQKKRDWDNAGIHALSQTQSCSTLMRELSFYIQALMIANAGVYSITLIQCKQDCKRGRNVLFEFHGAIVELC